MPDHFVPQLLLKNFAISGKPGKIYAYRRNENISNPLSIRKVAARKNFYTLKSDKVGADKRRIEKSFSLHETGAAPIIKHFLTSDNASLVDNDSEILSFFIAGLVVRSPWFRNKLWNTTSADYNDHMRFAISNKQVFKEHRERAGIEISDPEELERIRIDLQNFEKETKLMPANAETSDYLKLWPFMFIEDLAGIISAKKRNILESDSSGVFVISDNPVVLAPPKDHPSSEDYGFADGSVLLPISPKRVLYLRNFGNENVVAKITREQVDFLNGEIIKCARIEVYSGIQSENLRCAFNKTTRRAD